MRQGRDERERNKDNGGRRERNRQRETTVTGKQTDIALRNLLGGKEAKRVLNGTQKAVMWKVRIINNFTNFTNS